MTASLLDRRRAFLVPLALSLVPLGWRTGAAAPSAAEAQRLIETISTQVLAILSDPGLGDRQKFDALVALLSEPIDLDLAVWRFHIRRELEYRCERIIVKELQLDAGRRFCWRVKRLQFREGVSPDAEAGDGGLVWLHGEARGLEGLDYGPIRSTGDQR